MPHSQKLTELKEFKWALWGPLGAAVIVAIVITVADYLSPESIRFCLTSECFNDAIKRHKFSLGVAALVFPLVALVAAYHRSVQTIAQIERTEKQIKIAESKNSFDNYFKHQEHFSSFVESITKRDLCTIEMSSTKELYKNIFIKNSVNNFEPFEHDKSILSTAVIFLQDLDDTLCIDCFGDDDARECYSVLQGLLFLLNINKVNIQYESKTISLDVGVLIDTEIEFGIINFVLEIRSCLIGFISDIYSFSSNTKFNNFEFSVGKSFDKYIDWSSNHQILLIEESKSKAKWR